MSHEQSPALSIGVWEPSFSGGVYTPEGRQVYGAPMTGAEGWQHSSVALGGYENASFGLNAGQIELEDWLDALGWHVVAYDPALTVAWEGFVDKVTLTLGPLQLVRGPLLSIANRVKAVYSTIDTTTNPPTLGIRAVTAVANDTDSQDQRGIVEKVLSAGGMRVSEAIQVRDTFLAEHSKPETTQTVSTTAAEPSVKIECLGYRHWLGVYTYTQTAASGTVALSTKVADVLDADPNSLFSSANADIATNALTVVNYENDDMTAWALVKGLTALGDATDARHTFGVYAGRRAEYAAAPTAYYYAQRLADPAQRVTLYGDPGQWVKPWQVRPARWLLMSDFLVGKTVPTLLRRDLRAVFIERVTYTAPWGLQVEGGKVTTLRQKLARLGLAGIGA